MSDTASMPIEREAVSETLSEQDIRQFLERHPEFFLNQPEWVESLRIPHPSGEAISLIEYQMKAARDNNRQLNNRLLELIQVARENDRLNDRMHRFVLDIMDAAQLEELLTHVHEGLRTQFDVDAAAICLLGDAAHEIQGAHVLPSNDSLWDQYKDIMQSRQTRLGHLDELAAQTLFPNSAEPVRSCAMVPLFEERNYGFLAIGSHHSDRYKRTMGTVFVNQIGAIVSRGLKRILGARPVLAATTD
jgi:uncharacterized protein